MYTSSLIIGTPKSPELGYSVYQISIGSLYQFTSGSDKGQAARRRIRELEQELMRKEKALAETAALLVLRKKARAIWGEGEDV